MTMKQTPAKTVTKDAGNLYGHESHIQYQLIRSYWLT